MAKRNRRTLRNELGLTPDTPVPFSTKRPLSPTASGVSNIDLIAGRELEETREKPSQWEILKASVQNDNSITDLFSQEPEFPIDLKFKGAEYWKTQEQRIAAMPGIDTDEVMDDVVSAMSTEEAEHWMAEHEKTYAHEQTLIEAGAKGLLTRMAVSIADPLDLTLALATGGTVGALVKAGKFGRIMTAALSATVATGGTEAFLASNNAMRDETDVLFASLAGFGLGGGIAGLITRMEAKKLAAISDDIAKGDLDSAAAKLGVKPEESTAGATRRASESAEPDKKLSGDKYEQTIEKVADYEAPTFRFETLNKIFRTMQSKVFFSPSELVRKVSSRMTEGGYLKNKGVRSRTAEGTANLLRRTFEAGIFRESLPEFRAWAKARGIGNMRRNIGADAGEEFYSEVGRAMKGEVDGLSAEAVTAAKKLRAYMDQMYTLAEKYRVKGFYRGDMFDNLEQSIEGNSTLIWAKRSGVREPEGDKPVNADSITDPDSGLDVAEAGKIELQERGGETLQVVNSIVQSESRGLGNGVKLYDEAVRVADSRGLTLTSDSSVSDSAARVWDSMSAKGDTIEDMRVTNPDNVEVTMRDDGTKQFVTKNGEPVFKRVSGPERPRAEVQGGMLDDYFPRLLNRNKFDQMRSKYGNDALTDWYARAIESANDDIDFALSKKIAKAYVHTMQRKIAGIETDLLHGIRLDDMDKLREMFEGYPDLEDLVAELENMKLKENVKRGTVSHAKRRIQFDEKFEAPIKQSEELGDARENLKFHELYENDARKVLKRYGQVMSGHIGMARELGIRSRKDWEDVETAIMDEALAGNRSLREAENEVTAMREMYDLIVGRNTIDPNPTGDVSKLARSWTGYTYTTRGGQFGVNALAEIGNIIGAVGLRSFLRTMPEWKAMMKRGVDGQIEHEFARTVELMFAPGINGMTGVAIKNMDEFGERMDGESMVSRVATKIDKPLRVAGRATATASGLNLLTDLPQRIASVEMIRKFHKFATGRKKISSGQAARIRGMGIDDAMRERIFQQLRDSAILKNGRMIDLDRAK